MTQQFVFGYGSLVATYSEKENPGELSELRGFRRCWCVSMDNRENVSGYKYYLEAETGTRPDVYVTFLDIYPHAGSRVNGLVIPLSGDELEHMDRRERNYHRIDVSNRIQPQVEGTVWAYVGTQAARGRCEAGASSRRGVISLGYERTVRDAFSVFGDQAVRLFDESTDSSGLPRTSLEVVRVG